MISRLMRVLLFAFILPKASLCISQTADSGPKTYPQLVLQAGHTSEVDKIAFSRDGKLIASAAADNQLLVWSAQSGAVLRIFNSDVGVMSIAFSWDAAYLAATDYGGKLTIWNILDGTEFRRVTGASWLFLPQATEPDKS